MGKARINNTKSSPLPSHLSHPILSFPAFSSRNLTAAFSRKRYICAISKLWLIGGAQPLSTLKRADRRQPRFPTLRVRRYGPPRGSRCTPQVMRGGWKQDGFRWARVLWVWTLVKREKPNSHSTTLSKMNPSFTLTQEYQGHDE